MRGLLCAPGLPFGSFCFAPASNIQVDACGTAHDVDNCFGGFDTYVHVHCDRPPLGPPSPPFSPPPPPLSPPPPPVDTALTLTIIIAGASVGVLVLIILGYMCLQRRRRMQRVSQDQAATRRAAKREAALKAATKEAIKKLQVAHWQPDVHGDECAVCLSSYKTGDELRELPCKHAFHTHCIDQWLLGRPGAKDQPQLKQNLPACPLCKVPLIKEPDGEGVTHLGVTGVQMQNQRQFTA